jgi:hypothetical protein
MARVVLKRARVVVISKQTTPRQDNMVASCHLMSHKKAAQSNSFVFNDYFVYFNLRLFYYSVCLIVSMFL